MECIVLSPASHTDFFVLFVTDAIYEEAFAAREAYCSSLIATAAALQARKAEQPPPSTTNIGAFPQPTSEKARPDVTDASVQTDDWNVDKEMPKETAKTPTPSKPTEPVPKELVEESSSGDVLSVFLGMLFSSFFGLVWLVLVRIPFKIFTFSLLLVTAGAFLSVIWLYLADDHGAQMMGAGMQYGFNKPGIV